MRLIEKEEEELAYEDPDRKAYHLCTVNLVIGTLYVPIQQGKKKGKKNRHLGWHGRPSPFVLHNVIASPPSQVLCAQQPAVWHLADHQIAGAVQQEAGLPNLGLRQALLLIRHREHGKQKKGRRRRRKTTTTTTTTLEGRFHVYLEVVLLLLLLLVLLML